MKIVVRSGFGQFVASAGALLAAAAVSPVLAATAWNEGVSGDLSSVGLAPTPLSFALGANTVLGSMGSGDIDYFNFSVPVGAMLSAVMVNAGTAVSGTQSFFAMQVGPQITVTPTGGGTGPGSLLAFDHYDASDIGTNLLARLLPATASLSAGTYSVWLNETAGTTPYSFDFVLTAVPEPAAGWMLAAGLLALGLQRRSARSAATPQNTANPSQ